MEPFDERLNLNVWALDHERHAWDGRLAELRRNGSQKLREITEEVLQSERTAEYQLPTLVGDEEDYNYPPNIPRLEDVIHTHHDTMVQGQEIRARAPRLIGEVERALELVVEMGRLEG